MGQSLSYNSIFNFSLTDTVAKKIKMILKNGINKLFLNFIDEKKINKSDRRNKPIEVLSPLSSIITNVIIVKTKITRENFLNE